MAEHILIERYLHELRRRTSWHRDLDDLLAEVDDHLRSGVERLEARGVDPQTAQRQTLERFGDPDVVAAALASSPRGGLALPTSDTATGGRVAIGCALLWLILVAAWWVAGLLEPVGGVGRNASGLSYAIGWAALMLANLGLAVLIGTLDRRHGGLGRLGSAASVLAALAAVASVAGWLFEGWGPLVLLATLMLSVAILGRDMAPRLPVLAIGLAFPLAAVTWVTLRSIGGTFGDCCGMWGDDWTANAVAVTVGGVLLALGLAGIGRWLRGEEPAPAALVDGDLVG